MGDGGISTKQQEARTRAFATPLADLNPGDPELFRTDTHWPYFERLRAEDPVHWCRDSEFGPYWSVTRYQDIMAVDTNHHVFSSDAALGGITIRDSRPDLRRPSFIAMDPPKHDVQRKAVSPIVSPANLQAMEPPACDEDPRRAADRRDVRLGRQGVDRTDDADAGDVVRLPV
jgi:cytochrome P450